MAGQEDGILELSARSHDPGYQGPMTGGFLEIVLGCQGRGSSCWRSIGHRPLRHSRSQPHKVITALELLATLIAVKLWIPVSEDRQASGGTKRLHR